MKDRPVGVIGAGRVGTALGLALVRAGYDLVGITARSDASRQRAADILPDIPLVDLPTIAKSAGIILLSVTDDAIGPVARKLAESGHLQPGQIVMHVSGACGLAVLAPATDVGAVPLAIHPAMTFPGLANDADNLTGLAYAITARPDDRPLAEELVRDLSGVPVWIADEDRTLYHAALVLGANNLITLLAASMDALGAAGVPDPGFVLAPLVRTSLENALRHGDQALTGPVRRADTGTIDAHVRALRDRAPGLLPAYLQFGLVTATRARHAALNEVDRLDEVVALLEARAAEANGDAGR
ncbi:Rossmann-like and DUF2520 domain-containing protein [Micromonospora sp. NBC_01813]|uniref:Rossmann-like and DUF2520 domain-containing protein n=1 Tax=Micromonospora sp. NBC_01813 TaxID=2975988 RepID=UPI002DDC8935|nr:DUF2520 domain-containing protein [Micromonospora sp. NBC_01813]WSA12512.1 DUF2520 domain-containing protein [Micromonospora sp. NBC_01813]